MIDSTVLEVAIGLIFCFASVALIVSSLNEAIASALNLRAKTLLAGVKSILNDPSFNGLALDVYNHALVNPRSDGNATDRKTLKSIPSYIDSMHFAKALVETLGQTTGTFAELGDSIGKIQNEQLRTMLLGMHARSRGVFENMHTEIATWFDSSMARVAGTYKRKTQLISFIIALVIAVFFHVDAFFLFQALWHHPELIARMNLSHVSSADLDANLKLLPIGWNAFPPETGAALVISLLGCALTATTALFGAPFWFDLLQKVIQLRGTGEKPREQGKAS